MNYQELFDAIASMSPEQREQEVQCVLAIPDDQAVQECLTLVTLGTVDELGFRYIRSVVDNRRNGGELILLLDHNMHAEDGAIAYRFETEDDYDEGGTPLYPQGHDESADWTGPAQRIVDSRARPTTQVIDILGDQDHGDSP